ncbi:MAG TPA: carboxypeptidase-like regulatory domain-containing protein [Candidatus Limnocylindrales bacterium]|nr:carboxypeptidase-like regulatory domain-containing protein [Candidatus Limnocylindrales bacterium]
MIRQLMFALLLATGLSAQPQSTGSQPRAATGYPIAGVVVSSVTKQPLAGVTVAITATENRQSSQTIQTAADGRFAFPAVPAGKYSLTASAHGYRAQGFNQHDNFFTGIAVGPDLDGTGLVFRLVPDAAIEGTVTDDDGDPVRNANVQLFQRNNDTGEQRTQAFTNAVTDDRGHYQFGHLAPGIYFVAVSARPWYANYSAPGDAAANADNAARIAEERAPFDVAYPLTFYPTAEDSTTASAIAIHPGERMTADVAMRAVPAVHLRIKSGEAGANNHGNGLRVGFPRGFPRISQRIFEGALVPVNSAQGFGHTAGMYEYTGIAPGHYVIEMPESGGKRNGAGWYKEIDLSGTVELDSAENPPLASVSGAVVLEGATRPVGKMNIVLTDRTSREQFYATVSDKGMFDFADEEIRPGTYDVELANAPGFQVKTLLAKGAKTSGRTLEIGGGGSVQLVCTATRAVAKVTGVVLRDEKSFAGGMVVLVPRDPADWLLFRRDQSDSDGTFTLPAVLPGTYIAIAIEDGWGLDWASPAVLQLYLKNGTPVEVTGEGNINVKVQLQ